MAKLSTVPDQISFADEEAKILEQWKKNDTFKKSVELNKDLPSFSFYDGPPFATGLPHYGHILLSTIKDIVPRWVHQKGHNVERRFGWDTHGLPVEFEIDKLLGIKGPTDVYALGIEKYNAECRKIVMRYAAEWQRTVERIGRWIDFENDYKTLYPSYMESVWWVFSELYKKGLVYRGVKVMPFSTGCATPLSNFEAGLNYKDVVDPAAFIGFQLKENNNRYLVAWTTTPWTLPSNLALCVHPDIDYIVIKEKTSDKEYVIMEQRVSSLFKLSNAYTVLEKFKGSVLKDKKYVPLFPYFAHLQSTGAFRVLTGTFVTTEQGTGVVHQAPYFGEIDYTTCLEHGIVAKDGKMVCPVSETGLFTNEVPDYEGLYVKDADDQILKHLKATGNLIKKEQVKHSYPYCWRSETPLLYKAVPSWFIRVESFVDKLQAANETTYWVPSFVREKRFGNWLRDARDWAVSRNRFWGTPINLWVSDDMQEILCPSSIAELEEWTGEKITDIHRESIDHLNVPSRQGRGNLKRVSEVFDCWFESGSMPYAQNHYPFENKEKFADKFPADFVSEGIDQTRGWFYTLMVLGTALFNRAPFKNLICSGLILAADGNKMSKSKKNYPDPMEVINKYGADALRLYLINSPVVKGDNLRFREEGIREVQKDVFLPWFHAYRFFVQNVQIYEHETKTDFTFRNTGFNNVMDRWILSFTNSLIKFVHQEMDAYHLYTVVGPLTKYFETLTNSYIRLNRERIRGKAIMSSLDVSDESVTHSANEDRIFALSTLGHVLVLITRMMAPFTPFFCDYLWQNLKGTVGHTEDSVHFTLLPEAKEEFIDATVERRVAAMRLVVEIVRVLRERKNISVKYPLKEMVVINRDAQFLKDLKSLESYILSEVNVEKMTVSQDKHKYGVHLRAEPNFRKLGARLKADQKKVANYLKNTITDEELEEFLKIGSMTIHEHVLTSEDVGVSFTCDAMGQSNETWETEASSACVVMLNTTEDKDSVESGLAREIINRIQRLRKAAKLVQTEEAIVYAVVKPTDSILAEALKAHQKSIEDSTKTPIKYGAVPDGIIVAEKNSSKIKDAEIQLELVIGAAAMAQ